MRYPQLRARCEIFLVLFQVISLLHFWKRELETESQLFLVEDIGFPVDRGVHAMDSDDHLELYSLLS